MAVSMTVIGIPSWPWKAKLLRFAQKHQNLVEVKTAGMCYECSRHMELLKLFDEGKKDFGQSEYFMYQRQNKKSKKNILEKIKKFQSLYRKIKCGKHTGYPVVTDDGCRLDGSHRCSVMVHLSRPVMLVNMVSYESIFDVNRSNKIRNQVKQYRMQMYGL